MRRKRRAGSAKRNEKAFSASSAPWATRRVRVAAHPTPMTPKIGRLIRKKLIIYWIAACLDGLENGSHVSVTETERARLAIERVANIEQWRGDACLASRFGKPATPIITLHTDLFMRPP